jgi:hypothetical protein
MYKARESDLVGELAGLPIEVVQLMLEEQERQTGRVDVRVFQENKIAPKWRGGFNWNASRQESRMNVRDFWYYVLCEHEFGLFYKHYKSARALNSLPWD